ncbi:MAG: hypothetical protein A3C02_03295 [Candidatus Andersenbacteria bacterium RIFCSPHIGHO2_02_FULL_45_11]|uniref:Uncharacterized protein n=1 Tax=Candidatus Andersenbacteria bacterium RIFCSPHIGHO2_12_FULL_45_11 TaxID=1797281 RepID=A0A1G1X4W5_9BACT|nr:MAG: hypothetical protein A2805_03895 [Candidatus Andersenbacteria bacterium RIFCSPHIGHO2_01_FULL_46_36]OGY33467.1 MAG: hypothetical protein A3C02_03295 [Candidatus Andersenbacteria bacterium RIFCSPHIGHO2_02_FULL_45_11]OGY34841.1 MAG: hypothetical protein A3D99_02960 [Candidatus Andersenbacteria bacterium RIFCSPHIGHO2_12_FULL_45_11]
MGQSIFSNALIATIGRGVTLACGLAATALMTRMLGVGGFGAYSLILTIAAILQLAADFGLYLTLSRELGGTHGEPSEKIANIASLRLTLLVVLFGIGSVVSLILPSARTHAPMFAILAIGLIFQSGSQLLMSVFQAHGCVWRATLGDVVGRLMQVAALAAVFFIFPSNATALWVAGAFTSGLTVSFIIHMLAIPKKRLLRIRFSRHMWWQIVLTSWPIALMLILNVIYFRIDTVLLSWLRTSEEVGLYSLAYKVVENGLFFPAMIGGLLLPAISSALARAQGARVEQLITQGLTLSLSGAGIIVAVLTVFSKEIVVLLAGDTFIASEILLRILAIALGTMFLGNIFGFSLIALGKQKFLALLYAALMVGNVALNLVLIPQFGASAAAWVTVATEVAATVAAAIMVRKYIAWKIPAKSSMAIILGACASVAIAALLLPGSSIWVRLAVSLALYIASMHACGIWSKTSLSLLRSHTSL